MANPYEYRGSGDEFLQDYSPLAGVASAVQGFSEAYNNAQDRQYKRIEQQAQVEALKTKAQREKFQNQLDAAKEGYTMGADGSLQQAQLTPKQKAANQLKAIGEGVKISGQDEFGNPTGYEVDKTTPTYLKAAGTQSFRQEGLDLRKDAVDRREHERVLQRVNANPVVKTRLQQYQNLQNTLNNIANADHITPEMFDETQQSVRSNLGIKGSSGVGEREATQMKALGLNSARLMEFLNMSPADIGKDNKMLGHIQNLAQLEIGNISGQFDKALNAASAGHASMYSRRSDLKQDLMDAIAAQKEQLADSPAKPAGIVNKGLVKGGLVNGAQDAPAKPHPQDQAAVTWASGVIADPKAAPEQRAKAAMVLKANGLDENGRAPK